MAHWVNYGIWNGHCDISVCSECGAAIVNGVLLDRCPTCNAKMSEKNTWIEEYYGDELKEGD